LADNSKEQEWNKNESVPILHTTELEQEWNKNDFLEQKWNKNGPFLFNFRLQWITGRFMLSYDGSTTKKWAAIGRSALSTIV
jgi:predicted molibdopterin-dependent oxidoreductase YjgC